MAEKLQTSADSTEDRVGLSSVDLEDDAHILSAVDHTSETDYTQFQQASEESGLSPRTTSAASTAPTHKRLAPFDTLRGVLCMLLALDTAVFFSGPRIAGEFFWEKSLQLKGHTLADVVEFFTRFWIHAAPVGFFLLCGMGMALYAEHRKEKIGWGWPRILFYFIVRGLALFALQFAWENVTLLLRAVTMEEKSDYFSEPPISTNDYPLYFGALHTLGVCMVLGAFILFLDSRAHKRKVKLPLVGNSTVGTILLSLFCFTCTMVTQFVVPFVKQDPECCDPFVKWLVVAGQAGGVRGPDYVPPEPSQSGNKYIPYTVNVERVFMAYPILPWLAVWTFGVLLARMFGHIGREQWRYRACALLGFGMWVAFLILRGAGIGGGFWFGNFRLPSYTSSADQGNAFFSLSAFPPDLTYLLWWLGLLLVVVWLIYALSLPKRFISRPANAYGRSSLLFHLAHLWLYLVLGYVWSRERNGDQVYYAYPIWLVGLAILYPICSFFSGFKSRRSLGSFVRFL